MEESSQQTPMPSEYKVTAVVTEDIRKALDERARQENRSLSNLVSTIIKNEVESWMPKEDLAAQFLKTLIQGERPSHRELTQLARALDLQEEKLIEACDRLYPAKT
jgi:YesN/AraC family two-component response regulator